MHATLEMFGSAVIEVECMLLYIEYTFEQDT